MNDRILESPTAKRDLLYSPKTTNGDRNAAADIFMDAERFGEALEFLEVTRDEERLTKIEAAGFERGDTFLLQQVERIRGEPATRERWIEFADRAVSLGKYYDAYRALLKAEEEEKAEALRAEHMPDYEPFRPEGK
jgi:hypothetical protein